MSAEINSTLYDYLPSRDEMAGESSVNRAARHELLHDETARRREEAALRREQVLAGEDVSSWPVVELSPIGSKEDATVTPDTHETTEPPAASIRDAHLSPALQKALLQGLRNGLAPRAETAEPVAKTVEPVEVVAQLPLQTQAVERDYSVLLQSAPARRTRINPLKSALKAVAGAFQLRRPHYESASLDDMFVGGAPTRERIVSEPAPVFAVAADQQARTDTRIPLHLRLAGNLYGFLAPPRTSTRIGHAAAVMAGVSLVAAVGKSYLAWRGYGNGGNTLLAGMTADATTNVSLREPNGRFDSLLNDHALSQTNLFDTDEQPSKVFGPQIPEYEPSDFPMHSLPTDTFESVGHRDLTQVAESIPTPEVVTDVAEVVPHYTYTSDQLPTIWDLAEQHLRDSQQPFDNDAITQEMQRIQILNGIDDEAAKKLQAGTKIRLS